MPHSKSAMKRVRQGARRNLANRADRSRLHGVLKKANAAIASAPKEPATDQAVRRAFKTLDRAARKGLIKKNEADRRKARICLARNRTAAALRPS